MSFKDQYIQMGETAIALEDALKEIIRELSKETVEAQLKQIAQAQFFKLKRDGHIDAVENARYHLDAMGIKYRNGTPLAR